MKSFKNIWGMAAVLLAATALYSCSEDEPTYTPADPEGALAHVSFTGSLDDVFEVEPGVSTFTLSLQRPEDEAGNAETVSLDVTLNEGNVFNVPSSLDFAAGETEKSFTVSVSGAEEGTYYNLSIVANGNLSNYTEGNRQKNVSFAIMKWEKIGKGLWVSNIVGTFFGVDPLPLVVDIEKATTSTSTRFRFDNPYEVIPDYVDYPIDAAGKYFYYVGYPYNDAADIIASGSRFLIVCDAKGNATLNPVDMGMDWGYGMFSTGTILGNVSDDTSKYGYGTYNAGAGYVIFPPSSLYCRMTDYGTGACSDIAYLYLSFDAFLDNQAQDVDYENDYTWSSVEGAYGTYISTAADSKWEQDVEKASAVSTAEEDQVDDLYRFPDLFATGYPLVFNMTLDNGTYMITTPKAQKTGMTSLGGDMIYAEIKSGKCAEGDMQMTLNVAFYTMNEDGEKLVDYGTLTEEFQWGKLGVSLSDLKGHDLADYVGNWICPVYNIKDDSENQTVVQISASETVENTLVVRGLSFAGADYDDSVLVEWSNETGLLTLKSQWVADYEDYTVLAALCDVEVSSYYFDDTDPITMTGGITDDGVLAFLSSASNAEEGYDAQTIRFLAHQDGSPQGWLSNYIPYPMEWTAYASANGMKKLDTQQIVPFEKTTVKKTVSKRSFNNKLKGQKANSRKLIEHGSPIAF